MMVFHRRVLVAEDDIFAVQHRDYLEIRKAVGDVLNGFCFSDDVVYLLDFRCDISVDEILITLKLHGAVASDGLVMVACKGTVECVDAEVQNSEVWVCVFKQDFIDRSRLILGLKVLRSDEMV